MAEESKTEGATPQGATKSETPGAETPARKWTDDEAAGFLKDMGKWKDEATTAKAATEAERKARLEAEAKLAGMGDVMTRANEATELLEKSAQIIKRQADEHAQDMAFAEELLTAREAALGDPGKVFLTSIRETMPTLNPRQMLALLTKNEALLTRGIPIPPSGVPGKGNASDAEYEELRKRARGGDRKAQAQFAALDEERQRKRK